MTSRDVFLAAVLLLCSMTVLATELALIPGGFPAEQKPAFAKERAALVAEKRSLDGKVARYNKQCAKPAPHLTHKCGVDKQALYQLMDAYKLKVQSFNKRLAAVDRGVDQGADKPSQDGVKVE